MDVLLHHPNNWFLVRDGEVYYLDVNCEQSLVAFDVAVELSEDESREFHDFGKAFLDYMATKIAYRSRSYKYRNITGDLREQIDRTIERYLEHSRSDS